MRRSALVVIGMFALAGCAGTPVRKLAVCDGKHRRPANVYGTVLPTLPIPVPGSKAGPISMVAPGPASRPQPLPRSPATMKPAPDPASPQLSPRSGATTRRAAAPRVPKRIAGPSYRSC